MFIDTGTSMYNTDSIVRIYTTMAETNINTAVYQLIFLFDDGSEELISESSSTDYSNKAWEIIADAMQNKDFYVNIEDCISRVWGSRRRRKA